MNATQRLLIGVLGRTAEAGRSLVLRVDPATWIRLCHLAQRIAPRGGPRALLSEVNDLLDDPRAFAVLRRIVAETTPEEIRDRIWALLWFRPVGRDL